MILLSFTEYLHPTRVCAIISRNTDIDEDIDNKLQLFYRISDHILFVQC